MNLEAIQKVKAYPKLGLIVLAYIAFIGLGMPDGLLGVAWPSIRTGFSIPLDAIGMLLTAATAGYMTSSFFEWTRGDTARSWQSSSGKLCIDRCGITGLYTRP